MKKVTAVETLKTFGATQPQMIPDLSGTLRRFFDDKGYNPRLAVPLSRANRFGQIFKSLVLGEVRTDRNSVVPVPHSVYDYMGQSLFSVKPAISADYNGAGQQNGRIDRALANSGHRNTADGKVQGEGATTHFNPDLSNLYSSMDNKIRNTRIAVVGQGASGVLVTYALRELGFSNIDVYEKAKTSLGIWAYPNVHQGSRNNPRALHFLGRKLEAAPGSGEDVRRFLNELDSYDSYYGSNGVKSIAPGNLSHALTTGRGVEKYPIVINAIGLGRPRPLSDPSRMVTSATSRLCGPRWQQRLAREEVRGKMFVFIGLGNSTAEMLRQLHEYMDDGIDTDYRVVTHYPEDSVWDPRAYVEHDGKLFRVFRDLSKLNTVDFQGDLQDSLGDYYRALHGKKIIYGVKRWECTEDEFVAFNAGDRKIASVKYDKIFTLTGYQHDEASITAMGCKYDPMGHCAHYDYDGEFIANPLASGGDRLFKGYFGFGAILDAPHNRNAITLPGMFHRLGDLLFGVLMRSAEYQNDKA